MSTRRAKTASAARAKRANATPANAKPAAAKSAKSAPAKNGGGSNRGGSNRTMMQGLPAAIRRAFENPQKFLVPGGAVLGAGALATTGLVMREQLLRLVRSAVEGAVVQASAAADGASFRALLAQAGLSRKRTLASFLTAPWLGLAAGVAAASAATFLLAPRAKRLVRERRPHVNGIVEPLKSSASPVNAAS